jgi:hypothetical protein
MTRSGLLGLHKPWGFTCMCSPFVACSTTPTLRHVAKRQRNEFPVTKTLTLIAACLGAVFVSYIVLEALDRDLDLWPLGTEDFTFAPQDPPPTGGQFVGAHLALNAAIQCFVLTAGAHLVLGHRARSALATDSPSIFSMFTMAEPWGRIWLAPLCSAISFGVVRAMLER